MGIGKGEIKNLIELEPLVVGRREDAFDVGLALGGEGRVWEDKVQTSGDLFRPLPHHLRPHDRPAGAEAVEA